MPFLPVGIRIPPFPVLLLGVVVTLNFMHASRSDQAFACALPLGDVALSRAGHI